MRFFHRLDKFFRSLTRVYLIRFPLLTALLLFSFLFIVLVTGSPTIRNFFDVNSIGIFYISLMAFTTAWTVMVTARLALLYGRERFNLSSLPIDYELKWPYVGLFSLIAIPVTGGAILISVQGSLVSRLIGGLSGLILSFLLLFVAELLQRLLERPRIAERSPDFLLPSSSHPDVKKIIEAAPEGEQTSGTSGGALEQGGPARQGRENPASALIQSAKSTDGAPRLADLITSLFRYVPYSIGRGYFEYDHARREEDRRVVSILPGHGLALFLFILSLLAYVFIGLAKSYHLGRPAAFPTLAYVILFVMMLCWGFSALAFFFDRYRVPVGLLVLGWLSITAFFPQSDHFYHLKDRASYKPLSPSDIINTRAGAPLIVVAANGGGIQAGAWAARVLTGLEEACRKTCSANKNEFGKSVRLISSTSGGSVGAMYFVNQYSPGGPLPDDTRLEQALDTAMRSSLDEVAWGFVYPDAQRALFPFLQTSRIDRGLALEEAWARGNDSLQENSLSKWRDDTRDGWRPAIVFNATVAETGRPLLLATTDFTPDGLGRQNFGQNFEDQDGNVPDISIVTAARLSASFPYVSPAARAASGAYSPPGFHVVDGGYYDNYGMYSLIEWLDEALAKRDGRIKKVLVIQIKGSSGNPDAQDKGGSGRGWFYQFFAPLTTILNVRDESQVYSADEQFRLLKAKWESQVEIQQAVFAYPKGDTPLSWHLTEKQKREIKDNWDQLVAEPNGDWVKVKTFIETGGQ